MLEGKYYHNEHYMCNLCQKNLKGFICFDHDSSLWCENCYHKTFSATCGFCNEPIKEDKVDALGKSFHPNHFFCAQCGSTLVDASFIECQGKAFCKEDYATLFASRCATCQQPITEDQISAISKNYHPKCFVCSEKTCEKKLSLNGFYTHENLPYCEYHFYELQENICAECKGIIMGRCIVAFEKKFHPAHFCCSFCRKQLDGSAGGYREKAGKAYCCSCYVKVFS
ncbi:hypothetical protein BC833DRAFT_523783 [Globomyces pollinis-pini]|nr:hypothetical protein BC833DRAFT_523783 [Globomyces pollinis-pini]